MLKSMLDCCYTVQISLPQIMEKHSAFLEMWGLCSEASSQDCKSAGAVAKNGSPVSGNVQNN